MTTTNNDAVVALVAEAMACGFGVISERKSTATQYFADHPGCSGGDMLRAALGDFPRSFVETRRDLVAALFEDGPS